MPIVLSISIGAVLGALSRHYLSIYIMNISGGSEFPWGILIVNILGCFLMGLIIELGALKFNMTQEVRAFLAVGFLGSFTTFSTFALDFVLLFEKNAYGQAAFYFLASTIMSVAALFLALFVVRNFFNG